MLPVCKGIFLLLGFQLPAQSSFDSLKIKLPKHYFNTVIAVDAYRKKEVPFSDTSKALSKRLKSYGIKQFYVNFYTPLATKSWMGADSISKNSHLLLTGTFVSLRPVFSGITDHNLVKFGIGMRYIYNTGKKGVWFADVSPFLTRDVSSPSKPYYRLASTFIYSQNESPNFNWRLGITKSFQWGNRYYLPFIGIRVGRLDKVNVSLQFPRSMSVNVPLNSKVILSLYTRPQGGMYNFSNVDTLYFKSSDATFHFTRYELNSGLRVDVRAGSHINFYLASGLSSRNNISFYSEGANKNRPIANYNTYFYKVSLPNSLYVNFGLVLVFGKTRSYYNEKNIYDAADLNNVIGAPNGNIQVPLPAKNTSKQNLESVRDLVDYNDI